MALARQIGASMLSSSRVQKGVRPDGTRPEGAKTGKMRYAVFLMIALLAGCASSYQGGVFGSSVNADWESQNELTVTALCNEYTSKEAVSEYVSLRAAEEAINAGYRYMEVSRRVDVSQVDTHYAQTEYRERDGYSGHEDARQDAADLYANPKSTYKTTKPGLRVNYMLYKERPQNVSDDKILDAEEVYQTLGPRHLKNFENGEN